MKLEPIRQRHGNKKWAQLDPTLPETARFNMLFELGHSVLHATRAGKGEHRWFLFEAQPWRIQKSLSDLNGTDAYIYEGTVKGIFWEIAKAFVRTARQP